MTDIEKYRIFCKTEEKIPLFSKDWWLDAVCSEPGIGWNVILLNKGDDIIASMPYCIKRRHGLTYITMPKLTQAIGPWLRDSKAKHGKSLAQQKVLLTELIQRLPPFDHFVQNFHYLIKNWLPLHWQGFSQTTRYTYMLENISNLDMIWSGFESKIRTDIRKAKRSVQVCNDLGLDTFYRLNAMTFERQGAKMPYSFDLVERIDKAASVRNARQMFFAKDNKGNIHAAAYLVWDQNSSYYLMGGANPELRNSGASSLLLWEAIRFSSKVTKQFDFEGSMIESVERFFRAFGARQIPYFQIKKVNSRLLKLIVAISALR